jgi:hypothetical protein
MADDLSASDAYLIAAAPDLLAACEAAAWHTSGTVYTQIKEAIDRARGTKSRTR